MQQYQQYQQSSMAAPAQAYGGMQQAQVRPNFMSQPQQPQAYGGATAGQPQPYQPQGLASQGVRTAGQPQPYAGYPGAVQPQSVLGAASMKAGAQAAQPRAAAPVQVQGQQAPRGSQPMTQQGATIPAAPMMGQAGVTAQAAPGFRGQAALEQRVRELESLVSMKEETIQDLQSQLAASAKNSNQKGMNSKSRSPGPGGNGFRKVQDSKPVVRYNARDGSDPIDVRLEEFYNSTGSAIQFRRINRGFYRFGDSTVELDIINHKLMARTEDGWNRGKFGPVEKFLMYYENIEREKAGVLPDS